MVDHLQCWSTIDILGVKINRAGPNWVTKMKLRNQSITLISYETKIKTTNKLRDQICNLAIFKKIIY